MDTAAGLLTQDGCGNMVREISGSCDTTASPRVGSRLAPTQLAIPACYHRHRHCFMTSNYDI